MKVTTILMTGALVLAAASQSLAQVGRGGERPMRLLPDLKISLVSAKGNKAVVRVSNVCKGDAGQAEVNLTVYYGANKKSYEAEIMTKKTPPLVGAISSVGQRSFDWVFTLDSTSKVKSFDGKFISAQVDRTNEIKEASENNNWFEKGEGAAQPFPEKDGYCGEEVSDIPKPSFKLKGVGQSGNSTTYTFTVSNWESVPFEWLTGTTEPGVQCGSKATFSRLIARLYTQSGGGAPKEIGCAYKFNKYDLNDLSVTAAGLPTDASRVKLILEDRARKARYSSPLFDVEPFILLKGLNALGCKTLLGNPNSFLCTTDSGFKSCEDIRKSGKAIKCTRAGKQQ